MSKNIPISVYVHTPWCVQKCPYCDFNSHEQKGTLPYEKYLAELMHEFEQKNALLQNRTIRSIFIGGGTPSLMPAEFYAKLLEIIRPVTMDTEISLEANPGTVEQGRFEEYKKIGINRLSLGVQSFCDEKLKKLGRIHSAKEAVKAVESAREAGFSNLNIDLMFGLMDQTVEQALNDLQQAIDLAPQHISWYQLTLEPNTLFFKYPPKLPTDEMTWQIQQKGMELLAEHEYKQYEISAYSKPGFQCIHNLNYWLFGDYLGIGAGAHSKITLSDKIIRHWNVKHPRKYNEATDKINEQKTLTAEDLRLEFMLNAGRLAQTISYKLFTDRTRQPIEILMKPLQKAKQLGFVRLFEDSFQVTENGKWFLNELLELFM